MNNPNTASEAKWEAWPVMARSAWIDLAFTLIGVAIGAILIGLVWMVTP